MKVHFLLISGDEDAELPPEPEGMSWQNIDPPQEGPQGLDRLCPDFASLTWDVDMLKLRIVPECLTPLAHDWELARSGPSSPEAPVGMCIASWPFYVILTVAGDPNGNPEAAHSLMALGAMLCTHLRQAQGTNNPIIKGHDFLGCQKPWAALTTGACRVSCRALIDALSNLAQEDIPWQLWIFSFGMKLPARDLVPRLCRMWSYLRGDPDMLDACISDSLMDLGTEVATEGHIVLVQPSPYLRHTTIQWPGSSCVTYCLMAGLGQGYGGVTLKAGDDSLCFKKLVIYPGAWKHALMRLWKPSLLVSKMVDQEFYLKAGRNFARAVQTLKHWEIPLGGCRVEVRCVPSPFWDETEQCLQAVQEDILPLVKVIEISRASLLQQASKAYFDAKAAGLFLCRGGSRSKAPAWKRQLYCRLLASLGYGHMHWNRMSLRLAGSSWTAHPEAGGGLAIAHPPVPQQGVALHHPMPQEGEPLSLSAQEVQPDVLGNLSPDDLTVEESDIMDRLPNKRVRGGGWCLYYKHPWGGPGPAPKSRGYCTKAALSRALWLWAGASWEHRVKL